MKKLFLSIAAMSMILATGCQNEELVQQTSADEYSLTLDMRTGSRTLHNEAGECVWGDNEQLYVVGDGGKVYGTLTMKSKSADGKKAVFRGKVVGDPAKLRFMVYPVPETDGTIPMGNIDGTNHNAPMTGQINADGVVTSVDYAGGLIKVPVTGISDMVVSAENKAGKVVTGGVYTFNPVTGQLTFDPNAGSSINISNIAQTNGFVYVPVETDADEGTQTETEEVTVEVIVGEGTNKQTQIFETIVQEGAITAKDIPGIEMDENGTLAQVDEWDGTIGKLPAVDKDGVIAINTAEELAALAQAVNAGDNFAEKTIILKRDINLNGFSWEPIGRGNTNRDKPFNGVFDGNNHVIKNLTCEQNVKCLGLFGHIRNQSAVVKNLTLSNVEIKGLVHVGAVVGYLYNGTVENCHVKNGSIIATPQNNKEGHNVGAIAGMSQGNINTCTVENVEIIGFTQIGGIVGYAQEGEISNNFISNSYVIRNISSKGDKEEVDANAIGNITGATDDNNRSENVAILNGVTSFAEEYPNIWKDAANNYCVYNAEGLNELKDALVPNSGEVYRTIKLFANVDLNDEPWKPFELMFCTFDGQGHTISNLNVSGKNNWAGQSGFFSYLGGSTIKNLTLENVTSSGSQVGIFAGHSEGGKIENCNIAGENYITWTGETADEKVGNGIGVYTGVNIESSSIYSGEVLSGAKVFVKKNSLAEINANITDYNLFVGGLYKNSQPTITITTNGNIEIE